MTSLRISSSVSSFSLIVNFLENCFFPTTFNHSHDPHSYPRPTTHDPRPTTYDSGSHPDQVNPVEQVLIKPSLASPRKPNLASLDQTQSSQSGSNPVQPVGIKPSQASPDQSSLPVLIKPSPTSPDQPSPDSLDQTQSSQSRSIHPSQFRLIQSSHSTTHSSQSSSTQSSQMAKICYLLYVPLFHFAP